MSDGPHRSLKMPRGWKKLAERADNKVYAPVEVRDALPAALEQDWCAEVPDMLRREVWEILGDRQSSIFSDQRSQRLEGLRRETAGHNLGNVFLDYAIQAAERDRCGNEAVEEAIAQTLSDRATRGARQVEEHYYRESTEHRAADVRKRIEDGVTQLDMTGIAMELSETGRIKGPRRPPKHTGINEGVRL